MMDLQITVDFDKAAAIPAMRRVDIEKLIRPIPTANIVEGDPYVSVRVTVDELHRERLMEAVEDLCVVNPFKMLELYGDPERVILRP